MPVLTTDILPVPPLTVLLFYDEGQKIRQTEEMEKQWQAVPAAVDFIKINVRANPKIQESFHVQETPMTLVLFNGREIGRQTQLLSPEELRDYISCRNSQGENKYCGP